MDDNQFGIIRSAIDREIDLLPNSPTGIKMGFALAGAFLRQGLLETTLVDMIHWKWEMRSYRGRFVYPDPEMGDDEYVVGKPPVA